MKPARIVLLVLAVVALGAFTYGMRRGAVSRSAAGARVTEQLKLIDGYNEEKLGLVGKAEMVGKEMAALPDSVASLQTGKVVGAAKSIGKREVYLDGLIQRAERRIENAQGDQTAALKQMVAWGAATGLPFLVLLMVFVRTGRNG